MRRGDREVLHVVVRLPLAEALTDVCLTNFNRCWLFSSSSKLSCCYNQTENDTTRLHNALCSDLIKVCIQLECL